METRKPKLWSALIITILYIICFAFISLRSGDTITVRKHLYDSFVPEAPVVEEGAEAVKVQSWSYEEPWLTYTLRAEKPYDFVYVTIYEKDSGRMEGSAFTVDEKLRITDLGTGNFPGCEWIMPLTILFALGLFISFMRAFLKQLDYSIFSYNTPIYFGFGMMILVVLVRLAVWYLTAGNDPEVLSMVNLRTALAESGILFAAVSLPIFVIMTFGLICSNIALLRKEGTAFTNMLGIFLGLFLTGGDIALLIAQDFVSGYINTARIQMAAINGFGALFLYFACMWIGSIPAGVIAARRKADDDCRYLIVLGCGIREDGTVTPLLKGRCDKAVKHYFKQKELGIIPVVIPSGGQGPDEAVSESEAMKNYLLTQGIPEEDILMEDKSETTYQNFHFSRRLMEDKDAKTAFFTTNYHVFRSGIWARRAGFSRTQIQGEGAPTRWYFWPNAFIREFAGLLSSHILKQVMVCAGLILMMVTVTFLFWMV